MTLGGLHAPVDEDRATGGPGAIAVAEGVRLCALQVGERGAHRVFVVEGVNAHMSMVGLAPLR